MSPEQRATYDEDGVRRPSAGLRERAKGGPTGGRESKLPGDSSARRGQHRLRAGLEVKRDRGRVTHHRSPPVHRSDHTTRPSGPRAMANTTVRGALAIHGQNPQVCHGAIPDHHTWFTLITQYLVEAVIRNRIYDSMYWKEHCFALTGAVFSVLSPLYVCSASVV